jgi:hypothetical protein
MFQWNYIHAVYSVAEADKIIEWFLYSARSVEGYGVKWTPGASLYIPEISNNRGKFSTERSSNGFGGRLNCRCGF